MSSLDDPKELLIIKARYRLAKDNLVSHRYQFDHLYLPSNHRVESSEFWLVPELRQSQWPDRIALADNLRPTARREVLALLPEFEALGARLCNELIRHRAPTESYVSELRLSFEITIDPADSFHHGLVFNHVGLRLGLGVSETIYTLREWEQNHCSLPDIEAHCGLARPSVGEAPQWLDWLDKLDQAYRPGIEVLFARLAASFEQADL